MEGNSVEFEKLQQIIDVFLCQRGENGENLRAETGKAGHTGQFRKQVNRLQLGLIQLMISNTNNFHVSTPNIEYILFYQTSVQKSIIGKK